MSKIIQTVAANDPALQHAKFDAVMTLFTKGPDNHWKQKGNSSSLKTSQGKGDWNTHICGITYRGGTTFAFFADEGGKVHKVEIGATGEKYNAGQFGMQSIFNLNPDTLVELDGCANLGLGNVQQDTYVGERFERINSEGGHTVPETHDIGGYVTKFRPLASRENQGPLGDITANMDDMWRHFDSDVNSLVNTPVRDKDAISDAYRNAQAIGEARQYVKNLNDGLIDEKQNFGPMELARVSQYERAARNFAAMMANDGNAVVHQSIEDANDKESFI